MKQIRNDDITPQDINTWGYIWERDMWYGKYYNEVNNNLNSSNMNDQQVNKMAPEPGQRPLNEENMKTFNSATLVSGDPVSFPAEDFIGTISAEFLEHALPNYGYIKWQRYELDLYSNGRDVAIISSLDKTKRPATYQSWKEFLKNWGRISYVHPADKLLQEVESLEKANAANAESLRDIRKRITDLKYK